MLSKRSLFIQNNWVKGKGEAFYSRNPRTDNLNWKGRAASIEQINFAIKSAGNVQEQWWEKGREFRQDVLMRYTDQLTRNKEWLAEIIGQETGKNPWECRAEVAGMIHKMTVSVEAYHERCVEKERELNLTKNYTKFKPLGVIAILAPFNFPGHLPQGQLIPALLAGNTVVLKPSEYCPMVGLAMASLWEQSQPPAGVLNVIQGNADVGRALVVHDDINAIFFTGSEEHGREIAQFFSGKYEKLLALELGGNNPLILTKVKDQQSAIECIIQSAFSTTGQRCTCARRLIVVKNNENKKLVDDLIKASKALVIGDQYKKSLMGPLISKNARKMALEQQQAYIAKGAKSLLEMKALGKKGAFISPGIIDISALTEDDDEECFSPLLKVSWVEDLQEAIFEANKSRFGLSAALLSDDKNEFSSFYSQIKAGIINWNTPTIGSSAYAPFAGVGASGNHRSAAYLMIDSCVTAIASTQQEHCRPIQNSQQWFRSCINKK
ncbi:MAG: succinylglutamate-semialdehyde dehydrogenase [bacterium]